MSFVHNYSFRQVARNIAMAPLSKHEWDYDVQTLRHMFSDYPIFVEAGGLLGLCSALRTDPTGGLNDDEAASQYEKRRELYSTNALPMPPARPFLEHMMEAFGDPMLIILMISSFVSIAANTPKEPSHGWIEGLAIFLSVCLVVAFTSSNNYSQERAFLKLASSLKGVPVTAIRNRVTRTIEQEEILVGDVVQLSPGVMIPADGILIDHQTVHVNESSLTGEADEVLKSPSAPFLSAGTELVDGTCCMLVTAVGPNSAKGRLMSALAQTQEPTQLQNRLERTATLIGYIGLAAAAATFLALLIRLIVKVNTNDDMKFKDEWTQIIDFFIISVTIIAVAIPEGLPLAVTVSLAYSMAKMRADQNLVKVLSACETMGNATAICSDKTGTLTQNKMTVVQTYVAGTHYHGFPPVASTSTSSSSSSSSSFSSSSSTSLHHRVRDLLFDGIVLNSGRRVQQENMDFSVAPEDWKWEGEGGATEAALLSWVSRYYEPPGLNIMELRASNNPRVVQFFPFSSAKKMSSVVLGRAMPPVGSPPDPKACRQYFKGAADRVIKSCSHIIDALGKRVPAASGTFALAKCQTTGCSRDAMRGAAPDKLTACEEHSSASSTSFPCDMVCRYTRNGQTCNKWAVVGNLNDAQNKQQALYCMDPNHLPRNAQPALLDPHPLKIMTNMTREGLRCIAMAYTDDVVVEVKNGDIIVDSSSSSASSSASSNSVAATDATAAATTTSSANGSASHEPTWTLIGLAGIKDPLRLETRDAVMTVQQAGIVVRMVTGDNIDTAKFIAEECGIITHQRHIAIEGADFQTALESNAAYKRRFGKDRPEFLEFIKNLRVMARCQPEDKLELVKFLKEHGEVVGVTGDGSNDGPALKQADVGLAMGIAGTDVAKAAAKIIILDDNFSSIVKSVMWGRCVYDNIRKFLQFQCSVNFSALCLAFIAAVVGGQEPLRPVQLLWVNLIMDTMAALALGTEAPKPLLLQRRPYSPGCPLISKLMWRNIIGQGLVQLVILLVIMYGGKNWFGGRFYDSNGVYNEGHHFTLVFNTFVWLQIFNEINSRKVNSESNAFEGFFENAWFSGVLVVTAVFQAIMVEALGTFASTVHQECDLWFVAILFGATQLVSGRLLRFWVPAPNEHQIDIDPNTFENAAWIDDPSLVGSLFRLHDSKVSDKDQKGESGADAEEEEDSDTEDNNAVRMKRLRRGLNKQAASDEYDPSHDVYT